MDDIYKHQIHDDYYHLTQYHQNELKQIMSD